MNSEQIAKNNLILKVKTGSFMYGTNTVESDVDFIGICIPPKDYILGVHKFEQYEERTNPCNSTIKNTSIDNDFTIYSLVKFIKLSIENNPNILEIFFAPEKCIIFCNDFGKELLESRNLFLSKKLYYKFLGYSTAQKKKLLTKNPVGERTKLLKKHGYDTKYAMHLIRLLLFGKELLQTGELKLPTEYNKYLLSIRNGEWPLSHIIDKATFFEKEMDDLLKNTNLSNNPNIEQINKLQISLIEKYWNNFYKI